MCSDSIGLIRSVDYYGVFPVNGVVAAAVTIMAVCIPLSKICIQNILDLDENYK